MLRRLQALYLRYAAVHEDRLRGVALGPIGRRVGQVEQIVRSGDQVRITGWADATCLRVTWPGGEVVMTPDIYRADVAAHRGVRPDTGFEGAVPATARPLVMQVERAGATPFSVPLSHPADPAPTSSHNRLRRAFARDLCRAAPSLMRYISRPSERSKTAVKRALGLEVASRGHLLDPAWLAQGRTATTPKTDITIVLPIYNALPYLQQCLARVVAGTDVPWRLIAVDDASTDAELPEWLAEWAAERPGLVTILTQKANLGFIGAVNVGLQAAQDRGGTGPVILLNSDAMVPDGWASRLIAPLTAANVGSVTPMSNAAEVLSVPSIGAGIAIGDGDVDAIDAVAQSLGAVALPDIPTGVGFCMAMSRAWLAKVPRLDTAFGRGYGEEVDWCQKTKSLGARHLCQPRLFVQHIGGQSFGSAEKALRTRAANALIARRYPAFDANVQRFITGDPLATPRIALGVALAARRTGRLPVFLAHSPGGGAEVALQAEVSAAGAAVVLRVGSARRWQVEVRVDGQFTAVQTDDISSVAQLLAPVPALDLIYSCGVGDPDPITLPQILLNLRREGHDDTIALRLHDYFSVTPSYTLLGQDGFSGVPQPGTSDPAHSVTRPDGSTASLAQWRDAWGALIAAAHEVRAFSASSAALFAQAYPDAKLTVRPHATPIVVRPVTPQREGAIGVLGNVNHQKGARILGKIAALSPEQSFVVIGHSDSSIALPRNVTLHGAYQPEEISDLAERYGVSGWLVPAIWPETFSFTTREALATGLPVAGFDLGAQGEALDATPNGISIPLTPTASAPERLFAALRLTAPNWEAAE